MFGGKRRAVTSLVDRFAQHCHRMEILGDSYRDKHRHPYPFIHIHQRSSRPKHAAHSLGVVVRSDVGARVSVRWSTGGRLRLFAGQCDILRDFSQGSSDAGRRPLRGFRGVASGFPMDWKKRRHVGQADIATQDRKDVGEILERRGNARDRRSRDGSHEPSLLARGRAREAGRGARRVWRRHRKWGADGGIAVGAIRFLVGERREN